MATGPAQAATANVAVAANFRGVLAEIARLFMQHSGHEIVISSGSTGKLYTQIRYGAPYDVFLAADQTRPAALIRQGVAVAGSRFTYARGKLVLYSRDAGLTDRLAHKLKQGHWTRLAMANPLIAPYGRAGQQVIEKITDLRFDHLVAKGRILQADNITQAYQFAMTGHADMAFVALSQVKTGEGGDYWIIPETHYDPVLQDAVLLRRGAENPAATAFLEYLKDERTRSLIRGYGYEMVGQDRTVTEN
tara:strand:- start:1415 stop:2158 length:744 start_codon:yes stop_codon:yes gene_type:complete